MILSRCCNTDLGMLIESILMLSTTFLVRLKMESLSGFTDLVVSITKVSGGLSTYINMAMNRYFSSYSTDIFPSSMSIVHLASGEPPVPAPRLWAV